MKKAASIVAGLFFALTLTAQESKMTVVGNGNIIKEKRDISDFTKLSVSGSFEVSLTSSDTQKICLEGDENILAIIDTKVVNGMLTIATQNNINVRPSRTNKIKIKVPVRLLDEISLNGCGSITSKNTITRMKLKVSLDGPGSIDLGLNTTDAFALIMGSGSIELSGTTEKFDCRIVGAGAINAYDLEAKHVAAAISGSGDAKVNSTLALKGRIIGTGNIAFAGEPKQTDLKYMGNGTFSWE